jgi:hypothetical protein
MTGEQANAAYAKSRLLVEQGKYEEARAVELLSSDRLVIEKRIAVALNGKAVVETLSPMASVATDAGSSPAGYPHANTVFSQEK